MRCGILECWGQGTSASLAKLALTNHMSSIYAVVYAADFEALVTALVKSGSMSNSQKRDSCTAN